MAIQPPQNMAVPGASSLFTGASVADQVAGETEEERKKRLAALQANNMLPPAGPSSLFQGFGAVVR